MNHNIKISFRNARKNKIITYAKLFSLGLSFAIVIFAGVYAWYEKSFDSFVPDKDKIFKMHTSGLVRGTQKIDVAVLPVPLAEAIRTSVSEVDETLRISEWGAAELEYNKKAFAEVKYLTVDSNFFSFWGLPFKSNLENPFESKSYLALSESLAEKIYGTSENVLGKDIKFRGQTFTVSAVYEDFPKNFHLQYDMLTSLKNFGLYESGWNSNLLFTYIKTKSDNVDIDDLNFKLTKTIYSNVPSPIDAENAKTWDDLKFDNETYVYYYAERLKDVHFSSHRYDNVITANNIYVIGAIVLAILILLISSINYLNLSLAGMSTRLKEMAVKKANGAFSKNIFKQFLLETFLFWLVGFVIAGILLLLFGTAFKNYLGFEIILTGSLIVKFVLASFLLLLVFNLIINVLPVYFISRTNVLILFKNETSRSRRFSMRGLFVFLQFVFSGLIIIGAISVNKQINYMLNKDRGYEPDNVIYVNMWSLGEERLASFLDEMKKEPSIVGGTACQEVFGRETLTSGARYEESEPNQGFGCAVLEVDDEFFNTFDIQFIDGRPFNKDLETDDEVIIINELAAKEYPDSTSALGKNLLYQGNRRVIGIVKDFNFRSLHHELAPVVIIRSRNKGNVNIKLAEGKNEEGIKYLQSKWKEFGMTSDFNYKYVNDIVGKDYEKDKQARKLLLVLSIISIIIACTGLYAISYFTILKKSKEFAIRKINGASVMSIAVHISLKFLIMVVGAFVVSIPICIVFLKKWLANFAYQTTLDWWIFAIAIGLTVLVAVISIMWHVVKAATRNPVEALRYE